MNWNNVPPLKVKVYDPIHKKFLTNEEVGFLTPRLFENTIFLLVDVGEQLHECKMFPFSNQKDMNGKELYLYDKVKHVDADFKGVVDIEHGRWVLRYNSNHTVLLADRTDYIVFDGDPDVD